MRARRALIDALRRPTLVSVVAALAIATAVVVTQSEHGYRDVGMGIWWYEYFPAYSYGHGDFVRPPPTLPIYGNFLLVAAVAYVPVGTVERLLPAPRRGTPMSPGLDRRTAGIVFALVLVGGLLPVFGSVTPLDVATLVAVGALDGLGLPAVLETSEWGFGAATTTPAAGLVLVALYAVVGLARRAVAALRRASGS